MRLRLSALPWVFGAALPISLARVRSDGSTSEAVVVVETTAWEENVLMFRRFRLLVNLLQDFHYVACLVLFVHVAKKHATEQWVLLEPFRHLHVIA